VRLTIITIAITIAIVAAGDVTDNTQSGSNIMTLYYYDVTLAPLQQSHYDAAARTDTQTHRSEHIMAFIRHVHLAEILSIIITMQ